MVLDFCLNAISKENKHYDSKQIAYTAIEILCEDFGGDNEVLGYLTEQYNSHNISESNYALLLCEGWPKSTKIDEIFQKLKDRDNKSNLSIWYPLICQKGKKEVVFDSIKDDLSNWVYIDSFYSKIIAKAIVFRIKDEDEFYKNLIGYLLSSSNPSDKVSISKLLVIARGMSSEIRDWCLKELNLQLDNNSSEVGLDLTTGQVTPVVYALLDLL